MSKEPDPYHEARIMREFTPPSPRDARNAGPAPRLIIDNDGDACINDGREFDLVALPARDDNGAILNPIEWAEMVRRFNDWNGVRAMLNHERDLVAELEAELNNAISEAHETGFEREKWKVRAEAAEAEVAFLTAVVEAWEEIAPPPSPDLMRNALAKRRARKGG